MCVQNGGNIVEEETKVFAFLTDQSILFAEQVISDVFDYYFVMLQGKE